MGNIEKRNEEQGEGWSLIPHHHEDITFYIILSRTDVGVSQIDSNTKKMLNLRCTELSKLWENWKLYDLLISALHWQSNLT